MNDVPLHTIPKKGSMLLFSLLENRDEETFSQCCAQNRDRLEELHENEQYTCLQYACQNGLSKAVEALLANGADPNNNYLNEFSPIMMAGSRGYYDIVEMLAQHYKVCHESTKRGTVLHAVLEYMFEARKRCDFSFVMEKCVNCMEVLLKERSGIPNSLDINAKNDSGVTALHVAIEQRLSRIILLLLEHGAYIGTRYIKGQMAIRLLEANVFEEHLNNCIRTDNVLAYSNDTNQVSRIIYDYSFLILQGISCNNPKVGQGNYNLVSQTEPLIEIGHAPQLRHLLKHPVLASFLHVKWYTLRKYFWINFTFYLTFWFFLTLRTLSLHFPFDRVELPVAWCIWYPPSIILCGLLSLREFFKFSVTPTRYVSDWENFLNIAVLISNLLILCRIVNEGVSAITLLLTSTKMVLLINRHPSLSSNFEMYKAVCTSFLKLLAWWSMLIVAFALSFSVLFGGYEYPLCTQNNTHMENKTCTQKDEVFSKFLNNTMTSFFRVIIMMTGEFDAGSIPFYRSPGVSHVIFILFTFLVSIVFFNLMIGLAVSDTQAIRNNANIVGYATLAKQIVTIEMMVNHLKMFESLLCRMSSNPMRRKRVSPMSFPYKLSNAFMFPNDHLYLYSGIVMTEISGEYEATGWKMVPEILNETKKILEEQKSKREENEHSSNSPNSEKLIKCLEKLETYSEKLDDFGRRLTLFENKVIELLKDIKTRCCARSL